MRASQTESRAVAKDIIPTEGSAFLRKTYSILMNEQNHEIINWSPCGTKFSIIDHDRFSSEILPRYFKHNNTKSFVRQLNIHGFKKFSPKAEKGKDYYNDYFKRGQPDLLKNIERISIKSREENFKRLTQLDDICANGVCQPGMVFIVPCGSSSMEACAISIGTFSTDDGESSCRDLMPDSEEAAALVQAMKIFTKYKKAKLEAAAHQQFSNPVERDIFFKTKELLSQIELLQNISVAAVQDSAASRASETHFAARPQPELSLGESSSQLSSYMKVEASPLQTPKKRSAIPAESAVRPLEKLSGPSPLGTNKRAAFPAEEVEQPVSLGKRPSSFSALSSPSLDSEDEDQDGSSWFNTSYLYSTYQRDADSGSHSAFREFDLDLPDL